MDSRFHGNDEKRFAVVLISSLGFSNPQPAIRHAPRRVHGSPESCMVQGAISNDRASCINIKNLFKIGRENTVKNDMKHVILRRWAK